MAFTRVSSSLVTSKCGICETKINPPFFWEGIEIFDPESGGRKTFRCQLESVL